MKRKSLCFLSIENIYDCHVFCTTKRRHADTKYYRSSNINSLIRETIKTSMLMKVTNLVKRKQLRNIVATYGYFGRLILQYAIFNLVRVNLSFSK